MGIVAYCPNGHRTKVKDQFAGKKVLCPQCGARFRVAAAGSTATTADGLPVARFVPLDPATVSTLPRAFAFDDAAHPQPAPIVGTSLTAEPIESAPLPHVPAWHPRIAEQPLAVWSLARPGGEPSPPMTAADMQHWLDARQATGAELVWRSDWTQWLPIGVVFPEYIPPVTV
jgi:hypothetical protein